MLVIRQSHSASFEGDSVDSRSSLIDQINLLHEEKEHQKIIALIEGQPPSVMDYELT